MELTALVALGQSILPGGGGGGGEVGERGVFGVGVRWERWGALTTPFTTDSPCSSGAIDSWCVGGGGGGGGYKHRCHKLDSVCVWGGGGSILLVHVHESM